MDHSRSSRARRKREPKPLDRTALRDLALAYVARFATSSGKLRSYLMRKLRERGWEGEGDPDPDALVADFARRGFIDDAGWARGRAEALTARGYGGRRIGETLRAAGIAEDLRKANDPEDWAAREAIVRLARRRRLGPFGDRLEGEAGHRQREKQLAAMIRAGHDFADARRVVEASGPDDLDRWVEEAREEPDR